jgi:hypothetical protein
MGQRHDEGRALDALAATLPQLGAPAAREQWQQAFAIFADLGAPESAHVAKQLAAALEPTTEPRPPPPPPASATDAPVAGRDGNGPTHKSPRRRVWLIACTPAAELRQPRPGDRLLLNPKNRSSTPWPALKR